MGAAAGSRPAAWFVGLATLDVIQRIDKWPSPNEKSTSSWHEIAPGGPATNAAIAHAALGGRSTLTTGLGRGVVGQTIQVAAESSGVRIEDAAPSEAAPAVSSIILSGTAGERAIVSSDASGMYLEPPLSTDGLDGVSVVLVDGHHPELAIWAARAARARGLPLVLDAGRWKPVMEELLPLATDVICSEDFRVPNFGAGEPMAQRMFALGAERVAVTRGGRPLQWWTTRESGEISPPSVQAVDTLGAGDVFHGAYVFRLACGSYETHRYFQDDLAWAASVVARKVSVLGHKAWVSELQAIGPDEK